MANIDIKFDGESFRKDHPIILSTNRQLATILPVRLAYHASGYEAGRVLGRNSVSGNYERYDNGGSSGLDTAKCVLFEGHAVDEFDSSTGTVIARGIFGGEVFYGKLVGIDSNGETDLGARRIIDATGVEIMKF